MARPATQIAPALLKRAFADAASSGTLGGSAVLNNIARIAFGCIDTPTAEAKIVAYVVYKVLSTIAENLGGSDADWNEVQRFVGAVRHPLADAIDYLCKPDGRELYAKAISALIQIEVEFIPRSPAR